MCGDVVWDNSLVLNDCYTQTYLLDGEYIYFGEYPQSLKADEIVISNTVDDRGYYLGNDGFYYINNLKIYLLSIGVFFSCFLAHDATI